MSVQIAMNKIKVLIIDDSALIRKVLTELLSSDPAIDVVGAAADPFIARDKIKQLNPDVITLDVEMPRMDGITFLNNLMRLRPMPVIMISTLTEDGADVTLQALEMGAVDFVAKPKIDVSNTLQSYKEEIVEKVKMAARVPVEALARKYQSASEAKARSNASTSRGAGQTFINTTDKIIAIGSSTGGTEAVKDVLTKLPAEVPGIVVAQHIPGAFSGSFANRLNDISQLQVAEAKDGDVIRPGVVFIAPGDRHLEVKKSGAKYICKVTDGPEVNRHKPSVEVLMNSVAKYVGPNAMGIMLTGMGADGAKGMLKMKEQGAYNIAQDEKSSVVWGMPGSAVKIGAVDKEVTLSKIPQEIVNYYIKNK